jgi:hypothetical protein
MSNRKSIDMVGKTIAHVTVISKGELCKGGDRRWHCKCGACGKEFSARGKDLRQGYYVSCGCVGREKSIERARNFKLSHGRHGTPLYKKWRAMRHRCAMDKDYLSRGITICPRWDDFAMFEADMGPTWKPGLSLERIDNLKGYSPENCCWIPLRDQARNRTNCIRVIYEGRETFLWQVALYLGVSRQALQKRYSKGVRPPELFYPVISTRKKKI